MSKKEDLIYDLVSKIDERQRVKAEKDAARHANEDAWRKSVNNKLEEHSEAHKKAETRLNTLESPDKAWTWLKTKTGKVGAAITGIISTAYMLYRMVA